MLTDKMRAVLDTGAEIVTAGDNSCLMHIAGGLSARRAGVRAMHLAEILASHRAGTSSVSAHRLSRRSRMRRCATRQLRRNIRKATSTIRARTAKVAAELPDWEQLRDAGRADQSRNACASSTRIF